MEEDVDAHDSEIPDYSICHSDRRRVGDRGVRGADPRACSTAVATGCGTGRDRTGAPAACGGRPTASVTCGRRRTSPVARSLRRGSARRSDTRRSTSGTGWSSGWPRQRATAGTAGACRDAGAGHADHLGHAAVT